MSAAPMSILERLKARQNQSAAPVVAPAPPTPPVLVQTAFGFAPVEPGHEVAPGQIVVQPGQINPPEFQPAPTEAELKAQQAAEKEEKAPRKRRTKAEIEAARAAEDAADLKVAQEALAEFKASGEASIPFEQIKADLGLPQVTNSVAAGQDDGGIKKVIPVLYVDCLPLSGTYVLAADLAAKANASICADEKIPDYRFLQYGAGPGALRHAVMSVVDSAENCPSIAVDRRTPEGSALCSDLMARAQQIVVSL